MSDWIGAPPRTLNELEAFDAMRGFLKAYWERGGKKSDDLAGLLGNLNRDAWVNGQPLDIAQWDDFRAAVNAVVSSGE